MVSKMIMWIDELKRAPSENIAINSLCAEYIENGKFDLIARLYKHKRGVILGCNESISDLNVDFCKKEGYEIVRRPSGGSAIITEPDLVLCYSIFFNADKIMGLNKIEIHNIYKKITIPLSNNLGGNFNVEGNYYIRYNNNGVNTPIAGHAMRSYKDVTQFDGVINLKKFDISSIESILNLRQLYELKGKKLVKIKGVFYELGGKTFEGDASSAKLLRCEKRELEQIVGLKEIGLSEDYFISVFNKTLNKVFGYVELSDIKMNKQDIDSKLKDLTLKLDCNGETHKRNLGHCFVDFIETEIPENRLLLRGGTK